LITQRRLDIWNSYHRELDPLELSGKARRPIVPDGCQHNAHMYYLLLQGFDQRTSFINDMKVQGISCVFHYVPLHSSPAGNKFGRVHGELTVTEDLADRLVRLPLWVGLDCHVNQIISSIYVVESHN